MYNNLMIFMRFYRMGKLTTLPDNVNTARDAILPASNAIAANTAILTSAANDLAAFVERYHLLLFLSLPIAKGGRKWEGEGRGRNRREEEEWNFYSFG